MNLLKRLAKWLEPRNTASEILDRVKARGPIHQTTGGIYLPADPITINGLHFKIQSLGATMNYSEAVGNFVSFNLVALPHIPIFETPFVPQPPLLLGI